MVMNIGLSVAEEVRFMNLLKSPHWLYVLVRVMDLNHNVLGDISNRLLTGQVNLDITADVSRSCTMDLYDPRGQLGFDSNDPTNGSIFLDKMLQVHYCVAPPDRSRWYNVPIFTGPLNKVQRSKAIVKVEAQGKEIMARQSFRKAISYVPSRKNDLIYDLLANVAGEAQSKIDLAPSDARRTTVWALEKESNPWSSATEMAGTYGRVLFYDGRGVAVLRPTDGTPRFQFDGTNVLKEPEPGYDLDELVNAVLVIGDEKKTKPEWVVAPANHPLSPQSLARNGKPRYLHTEINDSSLKTKAAQIAAGNASLRQGLLQSVDLGFDSLRTPFLEEYDAYRYISEGYTMDATIRSLSIPLTSAGVQSVGSLRRVAPHRYSFRKA